MLLINFSKIVIGLKSNIIHNFGKNLEQIPSTFLQEGNTTSKNMNSLEY